MRPPPADPAMTMPDPQPRDAAGRFVNLDGSGPTSLVNVFRWAVLDRLAGRRRAAPDRAPVPTVAPDLARLAAPPGVGEPARVTWLGHASFLVQVDGVSLLLDPTLREEGIVGVRRNVPPGAPVAALPAVDAVLVTHSHYDHLDLPTVDAVRAPVVAGLGVERVIRSRGLPATELGWWASTRVGPVTVTFVPAQHWSRRGLFDANHTLWGGFVVEGSAATVYHSGDTAYFPGFRAIGERFDIDGALLPVGAYDPAWFMERQHMNPEHAVQAFEDLGAGTLVPMHWGTFKLADEPLDEPPARVEAERRRRGIAPERVRVMAVGETLEVGGGAAGAAAPEGG